MATTGEQVMGEVIDFKTRQKVRHSSAADKTPAPMPATLDESKQGILLLSEAFLKSDVKQRVLAGFASIFGLKGARHIPVKPRIIETLDVRVSVVHNLRTEHGKTVMVIPSAFPASLQQEAGLFTAEANELAVGYTFGLGTIIHGLKKQASHSRTNAVPPMTGVPSDSFDARQWPLGTTPTGVAPYRAAAAIALATHHPDGLLVTNPDADPDPQHRSIQISALANPFAQHELLYPHTIRRIIEDATRPASH